MAGSYDDLTAEEREQMQETGETPQEAHRVGEFEDLKGKLDSIESKLDSMASAISDFRDAWNATAIDDGAEFRDVDGDGDIDVVESGEVEEIPDLEDMNLDI